MVLAELTGGVAEALHKLSDRGVFCAQTKCGTGHANFRETGSDRRLSGDEGGAAGGAALLPVEVREHRAFLSKAIDVGRSITHDTVVVATDVEPPDVVGHDEKNIGLAGFSHVFFPQSLFQTSSSNSVSQPNGPTRNTMLMIAKMPISSRISAVINVSDGGNLLSPCTRPSATIACRSSRRCSMNCRW